MTFVAAVSSFARRFLTDRTFELVIEPALADFQFDAAESGSAIRVRGMLAVFRAVAGGTCDDVVRGAGLTFFALVLMPACYYVCLFVLVWPIDLRRLLSFDTVIGFAVVILGMSLVPALVCIWPERGDRTPSAESP
jgi:hypothetical protein